MAKREPEATPRARAFVFLTNALCAGAYLPGDAIRIADVARELGLSGTPVREALCRLAGAHLVDDRAREGFRMAQMTSDEISSAYRFEADVYQRILGDLGDDGSIALRDSGAGSKTREMHQPTTPLAFATLQRATADKLLRGLAQDLGARLAPYRRHENDFIPDALTDKTIFTDALAGQDWQTARVAMSRYADRCAALAHRLHAAASRRRS